MIKLLILTLAVAVIIAQKDPNIPPWPQDRSPPAPGEGGLRDARYLESPKTSMPDKRGRPDKRKREIMNEASASDPRRQLRVLEDGIRIEKRDVLGILEREAKYLESLELQPTPQYT